MAGLFRRAKAQQSADPADPSEEGSASKVDQPTGTGKGQEAPVGLRRISKHPKAESIDLLSAQSADEESSKVKVPEVSRRRLVLPVITILFISFLSIFAFIWAAARSLNEEAAVRDEQLAYSLLATQQVSLESAAREAATGSEIAKRLLGQTDKAWFLRVLVPRLRSDSAATSSWVLSSDGKATLIGATGGKRAEEAAQQYFPKGLSALVARLDATERSNEISGYLGHEKGVHLVAATRIRGQASRADNSAPILIVSQALDESFLIRGGINFTLGGLTLQDRPAPAGFQSIPLVGEGGGPLAYLAWRADLPGDGHLWPLSPALAAALIAIGYFLLLFVRGADLFMERQAYLAASLQQEQNMRNLKSRFVSMVSHELRTPLATIRNATEVLERYGERMSSKDREEETRAIHRAVDALAKLVDNVLVIGRADWMTGGGKRRPIDLIELSRQIWGEVAPGFETQARFMISEEGPRRVLYGDITALRALLSNLLSNAVKYSRGAGDVMMTVLYEPKSIVVRVTDFGIGIAPEELERIFEPFQRGANAEPMTGSGLGLSIARAAVQAMGGEIKVHSQVGRGTTFEISFPQDSGDRASKPSKKK